jgi:hypothetical protein
LDRASDKTDSLADRYLQTERIEDDNQYRTINQFEKGKGKGKAIPLEPLTGPEISRRLRLPDFKTIGT